jgi:tetratricopeptide (TPR) repeat protein
MAQRRSSKVSRSRLRDSVGLLTKAAAWFAAHPDLWFAIFSACWVGLLYRHVIAAAFVYDDVPQISKNAGLSSWRSVVGYFRSAVPFNSDFRGFGGFFYRPLFWASLALDRALWGLDAAGFHCTNLVLHWANGLLAFLLLKRLSVSVLVAAAVLLLWLGLPINAEVVAWISGRSISLAFLFLLTGLLCAECYLRSNGAVALMGYAIASLESLLSHEIGILTLPLTWVALYSANTARRRWLALSGVGVVVDALYLGLRYFAGAHISSGVASSVSSGVSVFVEAGVTFWKYVGWMVLPLRMSVERSTDVPTHSSALTLAAASIGILALLIAVLLLRKKMPEVAFGLAWLGIALAPFCGIVPIYQGMAERYAYLAVLGLVLAVVGFLFHLGRWPRLLMVCVVILWVGWGARRLNARVLDWRQEIPLYASSLQATPRSSALLYNLGVAFAEAGNAAAAADYYQRAIDLNPHYTSAIINLGNVFEHQGNYSQAADLYRRAIALDARDPDAWVNLGNVYLQLNLTEVAKNAYEKALALRSNDVEAMINLGAARQRSGDFSGAEQAYRRAIAADPHQAPAYCDLGALFLQLGNAEAAREQLSKALEQDAGYAPAYFNLGVVYEQTGRRELAAEMYRKALEIQPDYQRARAGLDRMQREIRP